MDWLLIGLLALVAVKGVLMFVVLSGCLEIQYRRECIRHGLPRDPLPLHLRVFMSDKD